MLITTKTLRSKKPLFADLSIATPPGWNQGDGGDGDITLRDVIEQIARHEIHAFRKRPTDRQFIRALSVTEIDVAVEKGKIEMGASEVGAQIVDEDQAVQAALVAFTDGLYLVSTKFNTRTWIKLSFRPKLVD